MAHELVVSMRSGARWDERVDRATRWGNPFVLKRDGTREEVITKYKAWLWEKIKKGEVTLADLDSLYGKVLGCWCAPLACHAEVLVAASGWAHQQLEKNVDRRI
jgi:hypothetical protein